jgi:hypothetical protein
MRVRDLGAWMSGGDFGARLALALKALSISRVRLAADLGVDKSVIGRWLNGTHAPTGHNLSNLTALVAARCDGFTMLDWDDDLRGLAAKLGIVNGVAAPAAPMASLGDWPPASLLREAAAATEARGAAYEGFWRSTRLSNDAPGRFVHDRILMRRAPGGLLEVRTGVIEMRFEGVSFLNQTQLFGINVDAESGIFVFAIFNAVLRHRADVLDGLTLTCTRNAGGTPVAGAVLMERTGDLSGDREVDDARYEASIEMNPLAPEGSIPEAVRAHLHRDVGPTAFAAGGEAMLTMAFAGSWSGGVDRRMAAPGRRPPPGSDS